METDNKETYWSRFVNEYEEKQETIVGKDLISLVKNELLSEEKHGNVLELGCGTGLYTEILQKKATNILATDYSEEMIAAATKKRGQLKNTEFAQANALNLEFKDSCFDTVFMANLIHIIGDAEKVIDESKRVLKNGGKLIVSSFAMEDMSFFNRIKLVFRYLKAFGLPPKEATEEKTTWKGVEALLKEKDFEITKSKLLGTQSKSFYITCRKNKNI